MAGNKQYNYISNMKSQYGENWIVALKPDDIQRNAKRIFRDMIKGSINYEEDGVYFLDGKFLENLIIAASNELEINTLYLNVVSFYFNYYPNIPNISTQINHLQSVCYCYNILLDKLNNVKYTQNIGILYDTAALLGRYRNHMN